MTHHDSHAIESFEPSAVWRIFTGIAAVPRPSKKEQQIRSHVRRLAEEKKLQVREDSAGNLLIEVPASPGHEQAPVVVLQGHLDMVCEKNLNSNHDFEREGIKLRTEKTANEEVFVRADGTTLGADNGIGVSLALAAATSPDVVHGPLEILCTVDEEMGMSGAKALDPAFVRGRIMLNLDSEEDDTLYIGCAGGCDSNLAWEFEMSALGPQTGTSEACIIRVGGLRGGHSGADIHLNRANAIKVLVRALSTPALRTLRLVEISGGSKRNAIPRDAFAFVAGSRGTTEILRKAAQALQDELIRHSKEEGAKIEIESKPMPSTALTPKATRCVLATLRGLPHGVLAVVPDIPGLVQTSNSVSTIVTEKLSGDNNVRLVIGCLARSSADPELKTTIQQLAAVGELAEAAVESGNDYPGWQPNVSSSLLKTCRQLYEQLFGTPPKVTAIHAGLECGIIGQRMGGMDMISFGPHITGAHSLEERVNVRSVQKSWSYLKKVLAALA
ncbi:MAG: beta-Ala-His dipeptidase [Planctomycetota bacterium]